MSLPGAHLLSRVRVAEAEGAVVAGREEVIARGREDDGEERVALDVPAQLARGQIPRPNAAILAAGGEGVAVGGERETGEAALASPAPGLGSAGHVPQADRAIEARGRQPSAVGGEGDALDAVGVPR